MAGEVSTAHCLRERSSGLTVWAMSIRTDARHISTRLALDFSTLGPGPLFMNLARRQAGSAMLCMWGAQRGGRERERERPCGGFCLYRLPRVAWFSSIGQPSTCGCWSIGRPCARQCRAFAWIGDQVTPLGHDLFYESPQANIIQPRKCHGGGERSNNCQG
jgi:hypothetical protein